MESEELEKQMREKYIEFQTLEQQMKQLQASLQNIDGQIVELKAMQHSIMELANVKPGSHILMPVASGIFTKGRIDDTETILVNVGSNVVVEKKHGEGVQLLAKQLKEIEALRQQFLAELEKAAAKMQKLETELSRLIGGQGS